MDDFMTKTNDVFPTQTQIENLTLQPNGLNAQRVRATNKRCACATREDKNPDRTRNSQQHVIFTRSLTDNQTNLLTHRCSNNRRCGVLA